MSQWPIWFQGVDVGKPWPESQIWPMVSFFNNWKKSKEQYTLTLYKIQISATSVFPNLRETLYKDGTLSLICGQHIRTMANVWDMSRNHWMKAGLVLLITSSSVSLKFPMPAEFYLHSGWDSLNIQIKHAFPLCAINILWFQDAWMFLVSR